MANCSVSQLQQKIEMIGKLREKVDVIKAESLKWKEGMDRFATEKEAARAQLSSAENHLQSIKEKSSVQVRRIEKLEARLAYELAKAESDTEKAKADADAFVAVYRADAKAAQTLEEIHARGFNLTEEIKGDKELEANAAALVSNDDDEDDESKSGSESGEEPDGEETTPGDNQDT
ncbi:tropomyosin-1-like [Nicotiana tomentosiformis]|uniref:tropomyosin-1-like n=1 Tax=Nicotiana tomentosiformis TaxID=4098 RepID=UPI00388C4CD9